MAVGVELGPGPSVIGDGSVGFGSALSENIAVSVTSAVGITKGVGEVEPGSVQANIAPAIARNTRSLRRLPLIASSAGVNESSIRWELCRARIRLPASEIGAQIGAVIIAYSHI